MPVDDHLSPDQATKVNEILSQADPALARAVSLQLMSDPVAVELSRLRAEVGGEFRGFTEGVRGEVRDFTDGIRDELRSFRWQLLAVISLAMVLNTALVGVGVVGRYGQVELEVNQGRWPPRTTPSPVVRPPSPPEPPAPLAEPAPW